MNKAIHLLNEIFFAIASAKDNRNGHFGPVGFHRRKINCILHINISVLQKLSHPVEGGFRGCLYFESQLPFI